MVHSRLNYAIVLFIMEIEFNIDRMYLVFSIYDITSIKYNLGNVLKLFRKFVNSFSWYKLFKSIL